MRSGSYPARTGRCSRGRAGAYPGRGRRRGPPDRRLKSQKHADWERQQGGRRGGPAPASSGLLLARLLEFGEQIGEAVGHWLLHEIVVHRAELVADAPLNDAVQLRIARKLLVEQRFWDHRGAP